jgi:hypothetical protein
MLVFTFDAPTRLRSIYVSFWDKLKHSDALGVFIERYSVCRLADWRLAAETFTFKLHYRPARTNIQFHYHNFLRAVKCLCAFRRRLVLDLKTISFQ